MFIVSFDWFRDVVVKSFIVENDFIKISTVSLYIAFVEMIL